MLQFRVPAKINWLLSVIGKRDDGYHDIESILQCIDVFDDLCFDHADGITLETDLNVPVHENLVYRAACLLRDYAGYRGGCRIVLKKIIPVTAGLGGGSSDAASTLAGLNKLWSLGMTPPELLSLASQIGSDVPFFLSGRIALIEGRGERVSPMKIKSSHTILLVRPDISVSASFAYSRIGRELTKKIIDYKLFSLALEASDYPALQEMVMNDLEPGVVREYPVIGEIKGMLISRGARLALMSGSGPTVFGVFGSTHEAEEASVWFGDHWCRTVRTLD